MRASAGAALHVRLLIDRLEVRDHLRKGGRQLTDDLADFDLVQLTLLAHALIAAKGGVALIAAEGCLTERSERVRLVLTKERQLIRVLIAVAVGALIVLTRIVPTLVIPALVAPAEIETLAAAVGGVTIRPLLALLLQEADDLGNDRQYLANHLIHILLRKIARGSAISCSEPSAVTALTEGSLRLLGLSNDLRQDRHKLANDLTDVVMRQLPLAAELTTEILAAEVRTIAEGRLP